MSLIKCDKCGELFSDSYRECPFCAEDEEYYRGNVRKGAFHAPGEKKRPSIVIPLIILIFVLLIAAALWYFFGNTLKGVITGEPNKPATENVEPDPVEDQEPLATVELMMDKTLRLAPGQSKTLTVSGGTSYEWSSSDPTVATVSKSGTVVGIEVGTAVITVTDSSGANAVCSVTVAEATDDPQSGTQPQNGGSTTTTKPQKPTGTGTSGISTGKVDMSKVKFTIPAYLITMEPLADGNYDVTMEKSLGENSFDIVIEGTSTAFTWSSADESVVSVNAGKSSDGKQMVTFTANNFGETTVTAKIGDAAVTFLVRVH